MSPFAIVTLLMMASTPVGSARADPVVTSIHPAPRLLRLPVVDANDLRFIRLSSSQGMAAARVGQIVQDDNGFMWFGSDFGLNRYDGYKFRLLTHDVNDANSLGGTRVDSLFKDRAGYLWIGTDQSLDRFDTKTERFTHYPLQVAGRPVLRAAIIHINQDHDGMIWLTTGLGLFRLNPDTGTMSLFQHDAGDPHSLTSNDVKSTFEDRQLRFWVPNSSGLDELDRRTGRVIRHLPLEGPIREFLVHEDRTGLLWLAYASGGGAGLSAFNPETNALTHYAFSREDLSGTAYSGVYSIAEDHAGNLWFGTGGMGLLKLDSAGGKFIRYRNNLEDRESLADDHIHSLLVDHGGNLWVGLNATGPNISDLRPPLFRHVIHNLGSHGAGEMLVYCIFQDRRGELWIGTASGLFQLDPQRGVATFVQTGERGVSTGIVSIAEDGSGDLWLGTVGQGLKRLDPRTRRIVSSYTHSKSDPNSLSDDLVAGLAFDERGKLWLSTWDGFDELDVATKRFTSHRQDPRRRKESYDRFIRGHDGTFWISNETGLARFDPRDSRFTIFVQSDKPGALSSSHVSSSFVDSHEQLWAATQNGLNRLNADGSFSVYGRAQGLNTVALSCILEDDAGNLWMSTSEGISRFNPETYAFTNYSAADGLGDLRGWAACFKRPNGEMLFGGYTGLIAFKPEEIVDRPAAGPIRLSEIKINGQTAQVGAALQITLSHEQRNFSLEFASLNFLNSGATRYRYRMDGLDSKWNEVGSDQRVVSYTSLPAGHYVFHAQAAVGRGLWSGPGLALQIQVRPPWWRSWWFTTMLAALLVLVAWAAIAYRLRSIARQYESRLEERVLERTRIARELHDSLLQGFQGLTLRLEAIRKLLPNRVTEAAQSLETVLKAADRALVEGREAVQDLRASVDAEADLEVSLRYLGEEISERLEQKSVSYRVLVQGKARPMSPLVRDDIHQIAREAFRNAVQHAQARNIEIELEHGEGTFHLRIRDDGVGIDPGVLSRGTRAGHWGMQGMRERAEALGGHLQIWSGSVVGTEVHLAIPAARAYSRGRGGRRFLSMMMSPPGALTNPAPPTRS